MKEVLMYETKGGRQYKDREKAISAEMVEDFMTIIHHVSVACPLCGETQVIEVKSSDQAVICGDCGIGGIVNFHGSAENRKMVIVWWFVSDTRPMPMKGGGEL